MSLPFPLKYRPELKLTYCKMLLSVKNLTVCVCVSSVGGGALRGLQNACVSEELNHVCACVGWRN